MKNEATAPVEVINAVSTNGNVYEIDPVSKKCKKVMKDFKDMSLDVIAATTQPLTAYQRYLKDKFHGEDAPIKKGKLHFRDYRIFFDSENGFTVEDTTKKYALVETGLEGIPTPKELGDFFKNPTVEHTPAELTAAAELGKLLADTRSKKYVEEEEVTTVEVDYEKLRKKVLLKVNQIRTGAQTTFDPTTFPDMIPFKKWKRKANAVVKAWKSKQIRYKKFLDEIEAITVGETFEVVEQNHRTSFVGTHLVEFDEVTELKGNKILVDEKWIDAVPFMQNYLLFYEPKAMQQLMRFANGEVDAVTLLKNPLHKDWKIEYNSRALENTAENAQILDALFASCGLVSPQELIYKGLEVGQEILIWRFDEWVKDVITSTEKGVEMRKQIGLLKSDKWIVLPKKEAK